MSESVSIVIITVPNVEAGEKIARRLVEGRLAACVNIIPGLVSIYHWQGEVQRDDECLLLVKSLRSRFGELCDAVRSIHPYTLPEIIAVDVVEGLAEYLRWIADESNTEPFVNHKMGG